MYHKSWWNNNRGCWRFSDGKVQSDGIQISNYSETTGSLWFHSKDETTNFNEILPIQII